MDRRTYWNHEYGCWSYRGASGDAAKRLAAYEDTGITPTEIEQLKADNARLHALVDNIECVMRGER